MGELPHRASADELRAIDDAPADEPIPDAELPAYYRSVAERLRREAGRAKGMETQVELLVTAEKFERFAESIAKLLGQNC